VTGRLKITGRAKELFKTSKGKYIAPAPIENLVANHLRVEACMVTGSGYPQPYCMVMLSEDAINNNRKKSVIEDLTKHLKHVNNEQLDFEKLAFFAVAMDGWMAENDFLTPTMKIIRSKLEREY
jgi:long-chain acyl-CoA synthetase